MHKKSGKKAVSSTFTRSALPRQVRIIGGQWKRTPLEVADAEGLRPTPDRVRETVFNWLTHLLDGGWEQVKCLDLFAGTGVMGFEAASRGAASVTMVEPHAAAVSQMLATKGKLKAQRVEILRGDAESACRRLHSGAHAAFDLIFLDPPYHMDWLKKTLPWCDLLLKPAGIVYAESEFPLAGDEPLEWLSNWEIIRSDRAGMVYYHLLRRKQFQA